MELIDQNSALIALEKALVPGAAMIDGRTELDMLSFVAEFASLVNFYDETNSIYGTWQPFLLKDPVFLLAAISKTPFTQYYSLFKNTCTNLRKVFDSDIGAQSQEDMLKSIYFLINQLFDQLTEVFTIIERWTRYMLNSVDVYEFKNYVLKQVKTKYSGLFWAMVSFRDELSGLYCSFGLAPAKYGLFDNFDAEIWKLDKDREQYWSVLETPTQCIKYPLVYNTDPVYNECIFDVLSNLGDQLFNFFYSMIKNAATEFEQIKAKSSRYPDTVLIRAFLNLFKIHQNQLNGLAAKHLEFYYNNILNQVPGPGVADSAFICLAPDPKAGIINLPVGTLFNAGLDELNLPVIFISKENVSLNPGKIISAHAFYVSQADGKSPSEKLPGYLGLEKIPIPGIVKKGSTGGIKAWKTFGGSPIRKLNMVNPAVVFATPLLFLVGGNRKIALQLNCFVTRNEELLALFENAKFYLSTQNEWMPVGVGALEVRSIGSGFGNQEYSVLLNFFLPDSLPPVVPYNTNPEKLVSLWPMLKIEFSNKVDWSNVIFINSLTVKVTVEGLKTSLLYNDFGALPINTPSPLFGPDPLNGSNFIFGNSEVFSKPLKKLAFSLRWDKLPNNFEDYYRQYNCYLNPDICSPDIENPSSYPHSRRDRNNSLNKIAKSKTNLSINKPEEDYLKGNKDHGVESIFDNRCFQVNFQILENQQWRAVPIVDLPDMAKSKQLFEVKDDIINTVSDFELPAQAFDFFVCDPRLQTVPLQFSSNSKSGFMKMELDGFEHGFGSDLYPQVVNEISLQNTEIMSRGSTGDNALRHLQELPNVPFVPKISSFSIKEYEAFESYSFDYHKKSGSPIQCFSITPFKNCLIYDSCKTLEEYQPVVNVPFHSKRSHIDQSVIPEGLPLLPNIAYSGYLFLEFDIIIAPCSLTLYFEQAVAPNELNQDLVEIDFFCLTKSGWIPISLLSDSTNGFTTSGLIVLDIPEGINIPDFLDAPQSYWLAIATKNQNTLLSKTAFLQTNGIKVTRVGIDDLASEQRPYIGSNTITGLQVDNPQIASVVQPFPSFGGREAGGQSKVNHLVSNRLKTKGRAVNNDDYYRLIKDAFIDIFYCTTLFDPQSKNTKVLLVKSYDDWRHAGAFLPFVSNSTLQEVEQFLSDKVSMFSKIQVVNFTTISVVVKASFSIESGYKWARVEAAVNHCLNIYLSPWITTSQQQYSIWETIQEGAVASFLKTVEGVKSVSMLSFCKYIDGLPCNELPPLAFPLAPGTLIVSAMHHNLTHIN